MRVIKPDYKSSYPYAEIIQKYRMDHELSMEQFADGCGCSANIVWRWEHSLADPRNTTLEYIREAFPDFEEYEKACPHIKVFEKRFSDVIKAFRKSKKLTRMDFAKDINVPYNTVCNWEYDLSEPRLHNLEAIRKAFPEFEEWEERYESK